MKDDSSDMLCRFGQHNSHALGGNTAPAGTGGEGRFDHHPPALFPPVPDAGQAAAVVRGVSHAPYGVGFEVMEGHASFSVLHRVSVTVPLCLCLYTPFICNNVWTANATADQFTA